MGYNKTFQNKEDNANRIREFNEWIISVGKHEGLIDSDVWIEAQTLLEQNKSKAYRKVKSTSSLLSGVLRCANCGSFMRPKAMQRYNAEGEQVFYYMCEMKEKSKKTRCDVSNTNGNLLDKSVIHELKRLSKENSPLFGEVNDKKELIKITKDSIEDEIEMLNKKLAEIDVAIMNIVSSIEKGQPDNILTVLFKRMEELSKEKDDVSKRISEMKNVDKVTEFNELNMELITDNLANINDAAWELMDVDAKRNMIKSVVDKILWDGKKVDMLLFGSKTLEVERMELFELQNTESIGEMFPQCDDRK